MNDSLCKLKRSMSLIWLIVVVGMPVDFGFSQTAVKIDAGSGSTFIERGEKKWIAYDAMVGQVVDVDGLAWGAFDKGLGAHLILPRGKVYLKDMPLEQNGRLVRVTGILRKSSVGVAPKGAQGYSQPFDYFSLDIIQMSRIEKVELDQLLPTKDDWVLPGVSADAVAKMIQSRNFAEHPLALAASRDGSTTKSFLVSDGVVLAYRVLDGRVISVSKIKINKPGKIDDEWAPLNGYKFPPIEQRGR